MQRAFTPARQSTPINRSFDLSLGTRAFVLGKEAGFLVGVTYADDYLYRENEIERKFTTSAFDPGIPEDSRTANADFTFNRGLRSVRLGGVANITTLITPTNKLSFRGTFSRNTTDEARQYYGRDRENLDGYVSSDRLRFVRQELLWGQFAGEHRTFWNSRLEWRTTLARAERDEPALRETLYLNGDVNDSLATPYLENVGESGRYLWSDLVDDDFSAQLDWQFPFSVYGNPASMKIGGAYRDRNRDFGARRLAWTFQGGIVTNIDTVLVDSAITGLVPGPYEFRIRDVVEPGDIYLMNDNRTAGYLMFDMELSSRLRTVFGARVENFRLRLDARGDTLTNIDQTDILPAVSFVYELNDKMNLRLAGSQTVDRPEFRELAPFQFTEASSLKQLYGNPLLVPATVRSADLRLDWFPYPGELISVSGFYKHLENPIEQVYIAAASSAFSYQNAESAYLYGVEFDLRKRLDFLTYGLSNFTFLGNLSVIRSNVTVIPTGTFLPTNTERPLQGQADYALNLGLMYQSTYGATELSAFFNRLGNRITAAGGFGVPDIIERSRNVIDAQWKQRLTNNLRLTAKASNLLNEPFRFEQEANGIVQVQRTYKAGSRFSLGLTWGF
jgi:TonB-dependent receptor